MNTVDKQLEFLYPNARFCDVQGKVVKQVTGTLNQVPLIVETKKEVLEAIGESSVFDI